MKDKWFLEADNTVLDCPTVDYKYNRDTYNLEKRIFWILSFGLLVAAIFVIVLCDNNVIQTIAGAFMGGILSLIVWLFTIRHQDRINYEIANVDMHITLIDQHLGDLHHKTPFIDPDEYKMVQADSKPLVYRFMHLFQLAISIDGDKEINSENLKLKFADDIEYSLKDYIKKCDLLCKNQFAQMLILQEKWDKIVDWNFYTIDRYLSELKKKLIRYKSYILCGNAPNRYEELKDIQINSNGKSK